MIKDIEERIAEQEFINKELIESVKVAIYRAEIRLMQHLLGDFTIEHIEKHLSDTKKKLDEININREQVIY